MRVAILAAVLAALAAGPAWAADARLERVGRFDQPVYVASPPGSRQLLVVVQRHGLIRAVSRGRIQRRPFADLRAAVLVEDPRETVDQRGLFSVAFGPDHARSGRFYVFYVDRGSRLRVDEARRGRGVTRPVLDLGPVSSQHHGGQLQFGPDGLLYVSTGMDEDASISQDPLRLGGKILRLDPRRPGARPEVFALGLRNPWRFSFDRRTRRMFIGDVGEAAAEEINVLSSRALPGTNFGWPAHEGFGRLPGAPAITGATAPVLAYGHARGRCAVTGGYVVRDRSLHRLLGRYVYADLCTGEVWSARIPARGTARPRPTGLAVHYPVSFGEDAGGRLYAVSFSGDVWRFAGRRSRR